MPRKPKHPCSWPGCPNLADPGKSYCPEHETKAARQYDQYERSPDVHRQYGWSWKRVRDRYVRKHPLCERCLSEGRYVAAEEVHHIVPVSKGGTNAEENLMSLCRSCHQKIHHNELHDR